MRLVRSFVVGISVIFASNHVLGQASTGHPQPSSEHERLAFMVGSWRVAETTRGTTTGTTSCEWFDGNFQVVCKSDFTLPGGAPLKQLEIFAYNTGNAGERGYARYYISGEGVAVLTAGTVSGKTWKWGPIDNKVNGQSMAATLTVTEVSTDAWASQVTVSIDGGPAQIVSEGTATRIK
jgi:uncharacterized protein YodC (DUF2158 family)